MKKKNTLLLLCLMVMAFFANTQDANAFKKVINCNNSDCLEDALANAQPGDEIVLAPGTYVGGKKSASPFSNYSSFVMNSSGNAGNPIILRGSSSSNKPIITNGRSEYSWYGINLIGNYWIIKDIKIEGVQKGIVLDNANHCQLINLEVSNIGQEAIHLRSGSSDNLVKGCSVSNTGLGGNQPKDRSLGEGIYVGSSSSSHSNTPGNEHYFKCINNVIENCVLGPNVTAEGVDIKEGTYNTVVRNCTFSAKGINGASNVEPKKFEDAFIDLKGARSFVYNNVFKRDGESKLNAGIDFQDRGTENSGFENAVFDNEFDFDGIASIPTMRSKGGSSRDMHFWNNEKNGNDSDHFPESDADHDNTISALVFSCPSWNVEPCGVLSTPELEAIDFTIVQNPGQKTITILGAAGNNQISVFDMQGKQIRTIISSKAIIDVDLSNTSNGVYIVTLSADQKKASKLINL